jgi:hypothetical protein
VIGLNLNLRWSLVSILTNQLLVLPLGYDVVIIPCHSPESLFRTSAIRDFTAVILCYVPKEEIQLCWLSNVNRTP